MRAVVHGPPYQAISLGVALARGWTIQVKKGGG